jgi:Putative zinc-finger
MFWNRPSHASDKDLSALADGALTENARIRVEKHVSACERCRSELGELREIRASLAALPRASAPRSFAVRQADVKAAPAARAPASRQPVLLGGLATIALVTFVTLVAVDVGGSTDSNDSSGTDGAERGTVAESEDRSFDDVGAEPDASGGGESAVVDEPPAAPTAEDVIVQATQDDNGSDVPLRAAEAGAAAVALGAGGALFYVWRRSRGAQA